MKNIWLHLKKILIHKWWVFYYCCKAGMPFRGIKHDMSKFSLTEFGESVKYYKGTSSPIDECKRLNGYSKAWFHHRGRNKHHWEYWTDNYDQGTTCVQMPYKYATEMFCDYIAAARSYMGNDFSWEKEQQWWNKKKEITKMHPKTKEYIDRLFMYCHVVNRFPYKDEFNIFYSFVDSFIEEKAE